MNGDRGQPLSERVRFRWTVDVDMLTNLTSDRRDRIEIGTVSGDAVTVSNDILVIYSYPPGRTVPEMMTLSKVYPLERCVYGGIQGLI